LSKIKESIAEEFSILLQSGTSNARTDIQVRSDFLNHYSNELLSM
jgi:hypothetical protein